MKVNDAEFVLHWVKIATWEIGTMDARDCIISKS